MKSSDATADFCNKTIVTTGMDKTVRLWDAATGASVDEKGKPREMSLAIPGGQSYVVISAPF